MTQRYTTCPAYDAKDICILICATPLAGGAYAIPLCSAKSHKDLKCLLLSRLSVGRKGQKVVSSKSI